MFSGTDPHKIMVALAGQLSGWPVPLYAGIATPVSVTTNQSVATPGGDSN
ncbi:MAG: Ash protein family protein [Bacteriophage sp.]|nr:MAG: Ash protein family protein [Bacteriophage sp.]